VLHEKARRKPHWVVRMCAKSSAIRASKPSGRIDRAVRAMRSAPRSHVTGDFVLIQDADLEYDLNNYERLLHRESARVRQVVGLLPDVSGDRRVFGFGQVRTEFLAVHAKNDIRMFLIPVRNELSL
jgi:hypothetical protein